MQHEFHQQQVEDDAEGAVDAVFGDALGAGMMPHRYFENLCAGFEGEHRDEAMQFAVKPDAADQIGAVGLQCTAVVVQRYPGDLGNQLVGNH